MITRLLASLGLTALLLVAAVGCEWIEKAPPQARASRADRSFQIEAAQVMRGTVASESVMRGYSSLVVRGYGLVVGLDGTGSRDSPPAVRAFMLAEMARRGIGSETAGWGHLKPEAMLDSLDTAVVVVEGVVPPGSVGRLRTVRGRINGTRFDVRVYADPRTSTTSLEGGRLYTTEMRPVLPGELLPNTGSQQAAPIAEAGGTVFINPFAGPDALEREAIDLNVGRVMNGGEVLKDIPIKLRLATPSHARAEYMQNAINANFPQEPGQVDPTAHGLSDENIRVNIPPSHRDSPDEFIELLRHMTIRQSGADAVANSVKRALLRDPAAGDAAAWRWRSLGVKALPTVQSLYDSPDELPRIAALRAGAAMQDPLATPHLIDMAQSASSQIRLEAVELLGQMHLDPRIDIALRELVSDPEIDVRLAAYEAQIKRNDPYIDRRYVDNKFIVDIVDSKYPLVYVTQIGQPRVAVFGDDLALDRPLVVDTWSGRLLAKAGSEDDLVEIYYRSPDGERVIERTDPRLSQLIAFFGHETTVDAPDPGLGLTYSETVGVVYQLWRQKSFQADFKAEQDRVAAAIRRQQDTREIEARPEFADPDYDFLKPQDEDDPTFIDIPIDETASSSRSESSRRAEIGP